MDANRLASDTLAALPTLCTAFLLPANGILTFADGSSTITLGHDAVFQAPCAPTLVPRQSEHDFSADSSGATLSQHSSDGPLYSDFRDPFYASTFPICYALGAATVTAYMLVIMLFITPRSFLDGGIVTLSRRSFTNSSSGGISIGGRPWLQKVAALTVAISLTLATADTFQIAQEQYSWGAQNAEVLQNEVMGSTELKVVRLISDTFLWLAQAQTLIRLFPRQREKIIIKWAAFALITLDLIFSAITSFQYSENGVNVSNPRNFSLPVPALSYLFQLSLGVLYAAWVIYYSIMKKRYAYYHPLMKNICLVAVISICSIIIPIVFFIMDLSRPEFTGWGDYVRWVGAAAASVVVWEWVERIEALEREEKKNGILGREVFDGDETLEVNASDSGWLKNQKNRKSDSDSSSPGARPHGFGWPGVSAFTEQYRGRTTNPGAAASSTSPAGADANRPPAWPTRPNPAVTPLSRTDTASAASTVYAVRYQAPSEATTRTPDLPSQQQNFDLHRQASIPQSHIASEDAAGPSGSPSQGTLNGQESSPGRRSVDLEAGRPAPAQPSRRALIRISSPPSNRSNRDSPEEPPQAETPAPSQETRAQWPNRGRDDRGRWDLRGRLEEFAANQADKLRDKFRPVPDTQSLPVTVIPAPPRRGAALQQVLEEEEASIGNGEPQQSNGSSSGNTSEELARLDRSRSTFSALSRGQEPPLPPTNPPLWPGVQRPVYYDDETEDDDDSSVSSTSSAARARGRSEEPRTRPRAAS
ncbi:PalH/RIM21-domain-containing protein [Stachybotrys elegans]|uniref:PalH/RIM21-domain-containing protein n=1 Tax=Stachybotrys elegans TaxID=80388 RepID=A0A8K0T5C8_9HYPO|nr:PalH/RIM21-domain-containing protein [Stachybotrys elegans]